MVLPSMVSAHRGASRNGHCRHPRKGLRVRPRERSGRTRRKSMWAGGYSSAGGAGLASSLLAAPPLAIPALPPPLAPPAPPEDGVSKTGMGAVGWLTGGGVTPLDPSTA